MSLPRSGTPLRTNRTLKHRHPTRLQRLARSRAPKMTTYLTTSRYVDVHPDILGETGTNFEFQFGGMVAEGTIDIRMQFVRKVYAIL
jgi:hypothetical protein